ncbi:hypothetical protein XH87_25900 [Bradyrhizobium sp. CCBAU 53415]|nr:hypothetical protein [Bradyrhizobium sp. CCBAU 53415]
MERWTGIAVSGRVDDVPPLACPVAVEVEGSLSALPVVSDDEGFAACLLGGTGVTDGAAETEEEACELGAVLALRLGVLMLHNHHPIAATAIAVTTKTGHAFELG